MTSVKTQVQCTLEGEASFFTAIKTVCLTLGDLPMEGLNVISNSTCIFNIVVLVHSLSVNQQRHLLYMFE